MEGRNSPRGLLKVWEDRRRKGKKGGEETRSAEGGMTAPSKPPPSTDGEETSGSGGGEEGRGKWKRGNGSGGGALGASHCDQRTNRWYIVFALAYHNLRRHHDAFISLCQRLCEGAPERRRLRNKVGHPKAESRQPAEGTTWSKFCPNLECWGRHWGWWLFGFFSHQVNLKKEKPSILKLSWCVEADSACPCWGCASALKLHGPIEHQVVASRRAAPLVYTRIARLCDRKGSFLFIQRKQQ